jgi:hypothetical protein
LQENSEIQKIVWKSIVVPVKLAEKEISETHCQAS